MRAGRLKPPLNLTLDSNVIPLAMTQLKLALTTALLLILFTVCWLKAKHNFTVPTEIAKSFLDLLQKGEFHRAHEMTLKNAYVGKTIVELKEVSSRQLCKIDGVVGIFPLQTNGNRLRRWLRGSEVEMPEIHVEFRGSCLLGVVLRHTG